MGNSVSVAKRPADPLLVMLPAVLWVVSLACDFLYLSGAEAQLWSALALYTMVGGLVAALTALALPGFVVQMTTTLIVVGLYAVNVWLRLGDPDTAALPITLSALGIGLLAVSWAYRDRDARTPAGSRLP